MVTQLKGRRSRAYAKFSMVSTLGHAASPISNQEWLEKVYKQELCEKQLYQLRSLNKKTVIIKECYFKATMP